MYEEEREEGRPRTELEVERRGGVQDDLEPGGLDDLVKGVWPGNVGHDGDDEVARRRLRGVRLADPGRLLLGADRRDDAVALGQELLQDVGWGRGGRSVTVTLGATAGAGWGG